MIETTREALARQYGTDTNLAMRQALWSYRRGSHLFSFALDSARLVGDETVVEVGCGNGGYLTTLRERGHRGGVVGLDLSEGMARTAADAAGWPTAVADAQALPLRTACADVVLAMHMLYHVPDQATAVAEFRRVCRPGGTVLVVTNGRDHLGGLHERFCESVLRVTGQPVLWSGLSEKFTTEDAAATLTPEFASVEVHQLPGEVIVPDAAVIAGYFASWSPETVGVDPAAWPAVLVELERVAQETIDRDGAFTVRGSTSVFVCR